MLSVDRVTRTYGRHQALSSLSLELTPGERLGLLGPNGAGKTTLLSILACEFAPTSGRVILDGHPVVSRSDARAARRIVGFLPQSPSCVPSFTAQETVEYAAWLKGVPSATRSTAARAMLDRVGLGEVRDKRMRALSGGMVQRTFLAAALFVGLPHRLPLSTPFSSLPRVLLLDEPTVGLDPAQRLQFRALVADLDDVAVVLSTHLVEDVAVVASRVMVLAEGAVRFEGTPAELARAALARAPGDSPIERGYMSVLDGANHAVDA